jgi:D-arabinose 1-dehydrogenase-like Zn-dependent alcohol dehydrogenase
MLARAMKAVICTRYGPPEVLRLAEVERPTPRRNQICIRIFATAVTVSDCVIRGLKVPRRYRILLRLVWGVKAPRRPIIGMVLAGDVESVGRNVTSFKEGDQVFGFSRWVFGAYAEEVCWPANSLLAPRPANLGYEEAAALPYGGLLAMHCLRKARLQPGQRVLIYGASGAIGTAAVQLARHFGAGVTGYTREDFTSRGERYDLILDAVGKRKSADAMRDAGRALTTGGTCISIDDDLPRPTHQDLDLLRRLAESGALKPVIDRRYRLTALPSRT